MDKASSRAIAGTVSKTAMTGGLVNGLLVLFKLSAGIYGFSLAMMADAVHSLSDFVTDLLVMYHISMERKPSNDEHDYGYGRVGVFAAGIVGVILLAIAVLICYLCATRLISYFSSYALPRPGLIALIAALTSIVVKTVLWRYVKAKSDMSGSSMLGYRAWQHRNDALSSAGTSIGIAAAMFFGSKWRIMDPVTAIIVCLFILRIGYTYVKDSFYQLTDKSLPLDVEARIRALALSEEGVRDVYQVLTRRIGSSAAIELRVGMDGTVPLQSAYVHVLGIEKKLHAEYGSGTHVVIRIEPVPCGPSPVNP